MKHEPRCIEIPCTCIEILREEIKNLRVELYLVNDLYSKDGLEYKNIIKSLENKIKDGLSCCCSGCTKHNQDLSAPIDK
jgi:hypothetical protein